MIEVLVVAEPQNIVESKKNARTFYTNVLNVIYRVGLTPYLTQYKGDYKSYSRDYPDCKILICHGLAAANLKTSIPHNFSILLGDARSLGFNKSIYSLLDSASLSSIGAQPNTSPYHFVLTTEMVDELTRTLQDYKKKLESPIVIKQASANEEYDELNLIEQFALGNKYPTITSVTDHFGEPILFKALQAKADLESAPSEEAKKKLHKHLMDLLLLRDEVALNHTNHPNQPTVLGKMNHALDYFRHDWQGMEKAASSQAQKDIVLYNTWKQSQNPEHLSALLHELKPLIKGESNKWLQTGIDPAIIQGKATALTYEALQTFDPNKSQLNTHIINHLRKLNRFSIENQNAVRVQEDTVFNYRKFLQHKSKEEARLGRDLTQEEALKGFSEAKKIGDFKPLIENYYTAASEAGSAPIREDLGSDAVGLKIGYNALTPTQKIIFEHTYGHQGAPVLSNNDIAKKLGISAAAVSKQKNSIEKTIQENLVAARDLLSSI